MEPIPIPPSKEADARNRAARTFWIGLGTDIAIALIITVGPELIGERFAFTADYWQTLAVLAAKTVITAAVSYVARKYLPPRFEPVGDRGTRVVRP